MAAGLVTSCVSVATRLQDLQRNGAKSVFGTGMWHQAIHQDPATRGPSSSCEIDYLRVHHIHLAQGWPKQIRKDTRNGTVPSPQEPQEPQEPQTEGSFSQECHRAVGRPVPAERGPHSGAPGVWLWLRLAWAGAAGGVRSKRARGVETDRNKHEGPKNKGILVFGQLGLHPGRDHIRRGA